MQPKKSRYYNSKKKTKKDPDAIRTSSWFITVNSHHNKLGSSSLSETQLKQKLNQVGLMFKSDKFMRSILYFATIVTKEKGHNWDTKVVSFDRQSSILFWTTTAIRCFWLGGTRLSCDGWGPCSMSSVCVEFSVHLTLRPPLLANTCTSVANPLDRNQNLAQTLGN